MKNWNPFKKIGKARKNPSSQNIFGKTSDIPPVQTNDNSNQKTKPDEMEKDLIDGMGYKSCWAVVKGSSQQEIVEALLQKDTEIYTYHDGLEKIYNSPYPYTDHAVFVTADFEGTNYIIGSTVNKFFYDEDLLRQSFQSFPKAYLYMTHRVSECHGFAMLENGTITRLYRFDEEEIHSIGKPLEAEKKFGYNLPKSIDEMQDHWDDDTVTKMDEEIIITLALEQTGIDSEQYPYENVVVGSLKL